MRPGDKVIYFNSEKGKEVEAEILGFSKYGSVKIKVEKMGGQSEHIWVWKFDLTHKKIAS